jgi:hypothetical protein
VIYSGVTHRDGLLQIRDVSLEVSSTRDVGADEAHSVPRASRREDDLRKVSSRPSLPRDRPSLATVPPSRPSLPSTRPQGLVVPRRRQRFPSRRQHAPTSLFLVIWNLGRARESLRPIVAHRLPLAARRCGGAGSCTAVPSALGPARELPEIPRTGRAPIHAGASGEIDQKLIAAYFSGRRTVALRVETRASTNRNREHLERRAHDLFDTCQIEARFCPQLGKSTLHLALSKTELSQSGQG